MLQLLDEVARALSQARDFEGAARAGLQPVVQAFAELIVMVVRREGAEDRLEVCWRDSGMNARSFELLRPPAPQFSESPNRICDGVEAFVGSRLSARSASALAALENSGAALDLMVSDVIVPDNGTTALEHNVRRRRPNLPILYMSGYSRAEMVQRGLVPAGGVFLQKPFTADELSELA